MDKLSLQYWTSIVFEGKVDSEFVFSSTTSRMDSQCMMVDGEIETSYDHHVEKGAKSNSVNDGIFRQKERKVYFTKGKWSKLFI